MDLSEFAPATCLAVIVATVWVSGFRGRLDRLAVELVNQSKGYVRTLRTLPGLRNPWRFRRESTLWYPVVAASIILFVPAGALTGIMLWLGVDSLGAFALVIAAVSLLSAVIVALAGDSPIALPLLFLALLSFGLASWQAFGSLIGFLLVVDSG